MQWWTLSTIGLIPLVAARMLAFVMTVPAVSHASVSFRTRVFLAVSLTYLITPIAIAERATHSTSQHALVATVLYEAVIGMTFVLLFMMFSTRRSAVYPEAAQFVAALNSR